MSNQPRIIIIMDPIHTVNPVKDTTLGMIAGAMDRGLEVIYTLPESLYLKNQRVLTEGQTITIDLTQSENWYTLGEPQTIEFGPSDIVLQRKDPPFNMHYIHTTYLLELMEAQGAFVCNNPRSLRDCNEKMFTAWFPEFTPPTLVSSQAKHIKAFIKEHHDTIVKPLDGMGGASIFRVTETDPNLNVILETLTEHEQTSIMIQRYVPEINKGDKRVILINGEPVPYLLARIPAENETRGNLAVGAKGVVQELSERDYEICRGLAPELKKRGLYFVGLDIIGDYLTEINVTSPTGIRQIDQEKGTFIGRDLIDALVENWKARD